MSQHEQMNYWSRRRLSRKTVLRGGAVASAGAFAAALVGCGDDDDDGGSTSPGGGTAAPGGGSPAAAQPRPGGVFRQWLQCEPSSANIYAEQNACSQSPMALIYNQLLTLQQPEVGNLQPAPNLAEKWEQPSPTTYVFTLRDGVKFHNGRAMTADDVITSFQFMSQKKPQYGFSTDLEPVEKIEATDPRTIRFTLKTPYVPFLIYLGHPWAAILPKENLDEQKLLRYNEASLIGTGPFIFKEFRPGSSVTLTKNPNYWKPNRPYLDGVEFRVLLDVPARVASFEAGQLETVSINKDDVDRFKKAGKTIENLPSNTLYQIIMDTNKKPYTDARVRQAIRYGTDVQEYIKTLGQGEGKAQGPLGGLTRYALGQEEIDRLHSFDLQKAKALLSEAGYADGFKDTGIVCPCNTGGFEQLLIPQMKKLNIDIKMQPLDVGPWVRQVYSGADYTMFWITNYGYDEEDKLHQWFHSKSGRNITHFKNARLDTLLDQQRVEFDANKRKQLLQDAQRILLEENPMVWLYQPTGFTAYQPYVKGLSSELAVQSSGFRRYESAWLDKS